MLVSIMLISLSPD